MKVSETLLEGVCVIEPKLFGDARGHFLETFNERRYFELLNISSEFVQDNFSYSKKMCCVAYTFKKRNRKES